MGENIVSAALATAIANIGSSKLKTHTCKHIWILIISSQLENVLVYTADVTTNRCSRETIVTQNVGPKTY